MRISEQWEADYTKGDPDDKDRVLYHLHEFLWSKPLPCGDEFNLEMTENKETRYKPRLFHDSVPGRFLSSDGITHTYQNWKSMSEVIEIIQQENPKEICEFYDLSCTIGGYIIFPSKRNNGKIKGNTINQMRKPVHNDRFDHTLECIRRWYENEEDKSNPLYDCLQRYCDFFYLFKDSDGKNGFKGYVDFFFLDALVDKDYKVLFWLDDFGVRNPLPNDADKYRRYMKNVSKFIKERNKLVDKQKYK